VALAAVLLTSSSQAASGDLDPTFGSGGKVLTDFGSSVDAARALAVRSNGQIVAAGESAYGSGTYDFAVARYNADGSLDPSFGSGGKVLTDLNASSVDEAFALALQPNGKIVAVGRTRSADGAFDFALVRYNADGGLDPSFGADGKVVTDLNSSIGDEGLAVALQQDGKIVAAGVSAGDFAVFRYNADGSLDAGFGARGKALTDLGSSRFDEAHAVLLQPDGKIVAAGRSITGSSVDFALVRYNPDGSLDPTFGAGGKVLTDLGSSRFDEAHAVLLQPDGKILAAGRSNATGRFDFALVRYNPDGSLDPSFGTRGKVLTDIDSRLDEVSAIALQPNGKIVAAGMSDTRASLDFAVVRYDAAGRLDPTFGTGGKVLTDLGNSSFDDAFALALQNGRIVAAGVSNASGSLDFALARYVGRCGCR
jgi:uncharacterized delta-60 repeat protein